MTTDKITQYLEQMAAKLGVAAEHVYGVFVRQYIAEGIVILLATVVAAIGLYKFSQILWERYKTDSAVVLIGAITAITVTLGFEQVSEGIKRVINPEYYVIRDIVNAVAGKEVIGGVTR